MKKKTALLEKSLSSLAHKEISALTKAMENFMSAATSYAKLHKRNPVHKKIAKHHAVLRSHMAQLEKVNR